MSEQVISFARCSCSAGEDETVLIATTSPRVVVEGKTVATVADLIFGGTFGHCKELDGPCAYAPAATWTVFGSPVFFGGLPPLLKGATLGCVHKGEIHVLDANQMTTVTGEAVLLDAEVQAMAFALPPWLPEWVRDYWLSRSITTPICDQDVNEDNPVCNIPNGSDPPSDLFDGPNPPGPPPSPVRLVPHRPPVSAPVKDKPSLPERIWGGIGDANDWIDDRLDDVAERLPTNEPNPGLPVFPFAPPRPGPG